MSNKLWLHTNLSDQFQNYHRSAKFHKINPLYVRAQWVHKTHHTTGTGRPDDQSTQTTQISKQDWQQIVCVQYIICGPGRNWGFGLRLIVELAADWVWAVSMYPWLHHFTSVQDMHQCSRFKTQISLQLLPHGVAYIHQLQYKWTHMY